jgi:hypothetical protein
MRSIQWETTEYAQGIVRIDGWDLLNVVDINTTIIYPSAGHGTTAESSRPQEAESRNLTAHQRPKDLQSHSNI